jgi:hypothetical protein
LTTETQQALAVLFRRFNDEAVPRDDLVKAMSLELDWTKPSRAENLLDRGLNAGHVEEREAGLAAGFDPAEVDVPFGFAPDEELFEPVETETSEDEDDGGGVAGEPMLEELLDRIAAARDGGRNKAMAAASARQDAMGGLVTIEAAALSVAHSEGLDVGEEAEQVLDSLRRA